MAKKSNPEIEIKAMTAFEIAAELRQVVQAVIDAEGECSDDQYAALQQWTAALEVKGENIAHVLERLDNEAEFYQQIEKRAYARAKARTDAAVRLKKHLAECMMTAGVKSIKKTDGLFSITLCDGRASVKIDDPARLVIGETVDIVEELKPRTSEIKRLLEGGTEVPGAHLEYGQPYLMVR